MPSLKSTKQRLCLPTASLLELRRDQSQLQSLLSNMMSKYVGVSWYPVILLTYQHGLLSATPVLKRATSPSSPGVPISPLTAIKSSANRLSAIKERVFGDEHHEKLKAMISGPIPYAPNLDRSWSVRSYGARHGTSPIASPKIDHPKKFEEQVFKEDSSGSEENDIATAMSKMDEQTG